LIGTGDVVRVVRHEAGDHLNQWDRTH
jgi:hypothetical protein